MKNKKIFNELIRERSFKFHNLEKRSNINNLTYNYKTKGMSPKDFSNYQNSIDLSKNSIDDNINSNEVLKNQVILKSDLGEIKKIQI